MNNTVQARVKGILCAILPEANVTKLDATDSFFANGIIFDSVDLITLIIELESEFCIELSDDDILSDFDSLDDLTKMIAKYIDRGLL